MSSDKNKRNLSKKEIFWTAVGILFLTFCIFLIVHYSINNNRGDGKHSENVGNRVENKLPDLMSIDENKNPILYDFVNSSISYKMNIPNIEDFGMFYAILQNNDNPKDETYIEYYMCGENLIRPLIGNRYKNMNLNQSEVDAIKDFGSQIPDNLNRKFNEDSEWGNWSLYLISEYSVDKDRDKYYSCIAERWAGIRLKDFIDTSENSIKSPMYDYVIEKGNGYPLEWLQKEPYPEILYLDGYDINDEFWKKYPIDSFIVYKNKNDETNTVKVYVEQLDRFKFEYKGETFRLNEFELKEFMEENNYEL